MSLMSRDNNGQRLDIVARKCSLYKNHVLFVLILIIMQNCLYEYMLSLFESIYTLKGRYNIGKIGKTAYMSTCLFSLNQYIHGREGTTSVMLSKTASLSTLTLFESIYTLKGRYNIGNIGKTASLSMLILSLNQDIH